jgi:hypothetical protein
MILKLGGGQNTCLTPHSSPKRRETGSHLRLNYSLNHCLIPLNQHTTDPRETAVTHLKRKQTMNKYVALPINPRRDDVGTPKKGNTNEQ